MCILIHIFEKIGVILFFLFYISFIFYYFLIFYFLFITFYFAYFLLFLKIFIIFHFFFFLLENWKLFFYKIKKTNLTSVHCLTSCQKWNSFSFYFSSFSHLDLTKAIIFFPRSLPIIFSCCLFLWLCTFSFCIFSWFDIFI